MKTYFIDIQNNYLIYKNDNVKYYFISNNIPKRRISDIEFRNLKTIKINRVLRYF